MGRRGSDSWLWPFPIGLSQPGSVFRLASEACEAEFTLPRSFAYYRHFKQGLPSKVLEHFEMSTGSCRSCFTCERTWRRASRGVKEIAFAGSHECNRGAQYLRIIRFIRKNFSTLIFSNLSTINQITNLQTLQPSTKNPLQTTIKMETINNAASCKTLLSLLMLFIC